MPNNVRNFWIELTVDGVTKRIATGPRSKDGGFTLTILQRDKGEIVKAARIVGMATANGKIFMDAEFKADNPSVSVIRVSTER